MYFYCAEKVQLLVINKKRRLKEKNLRKRKVGKVIMKKINRLIIIMRIRNSDNV